MSVSPPTILTQVSLGSLTNIWGVDASNNIYQYNGSVWTRIAGALKQVSAAPDGTVWGIAVDNTVYSYSGNNTWTKMPGILKQVSVGSSSNVWGVSPINQTFIYDQGTWVKVADGTITQVCAEQQSGPPIAATAWGLTPQGGLSRGFYYQGKADWNAVSNGPGHPSAHLVSMSLITVRKLTTSLYDVNNGSLYVVDSAGITYGWIAGGTGLSQINKPLARSFAYTLATDNRTWIHVLLDLQGTTQQDPQSAGWNTAAVEPTEPVREVPSRYLKLINRNSGKVLDVNASSMDDGAQIQQWWYGGGTNQQWRLEPTTENYYKIVNRNSEKLLDVKDNSMVDGAIVTQWGDNGGMNQQWRLEPTTENYYKIVNRNSGKVLDVKGKSLNDGAIVQQYYYGEGTNQQWSLETIS